MRRNTVLLVFLLLLVSNPAWTQPVDRGLVIRYYLDEAGSGQGISVAKDASGVGLPFDLAITYDASNLNYTLIGGNRGLESTNIEGDQNASKDISDTSDKIRDNIHGIQKATLEVVCRADSFHGGGGRLFGINAGTSNGQFVLRGATSSFQFALQVGGTGLVHRTWTDGIGVRSVFHIVVDTTQATADDRIKVYRNGVLISPTIDNNPTLDGTINLITTNPNRLWMFNRGDAPRSRSTDGVLFYGAMYSVAFSPGEVLLNAASPRLRFNDDQILKVVALVPKLTRKWPAVPPAGAARRLMIISSGMLNRVSPTIESRRN